ncbi:hypothetical protein EI94DRAFT_1752369 [Lactarius quietus]|nr:hypothetical protein EI94DRAFT_1752369 [Lactarius quietus]
MSVEGMCRRGRGSRKRGALRALAPFEDGGARGRGGGLDLRRCVDPHRRVFACFSLRPLCEESGRGQQGRWGSGSARWGEMDRARRSYSFLRWHAFSCHFCSGRDEAEVETRLGLLTIQASKRNERHGPGVWGLQTCGVGRVDSVGLLAWGVWARGDAGGGGGNAGRSNRVAAAARRRKRAVAAGGRRAGQGREEASGCCVVTRLRTRVCCFPIG